MKILEKWAREGRIARIDFTHLMYLIWSVTQAYADLAPQFAMLLGQPKLDAKDFCRGGEGVDAAGDGGAEEGNLSSVWCIITIGCLSLEWPCKNKIC